MTARLTRTALPLAALLCLPGIAVAAYLTVVHYAHQPIACSGIGDCELVNSSHYATLGGVPVALLGAGAYATMLALAAGAWLRRDAALLLAAWSVAAASFGFSMYLTYVEMRILHAICVYCVASASIVTTVFALMGAALWSARVEVFGEEVEQAPLRA
jgi:uncharacterized membrane protein